MTRVKLWKNKATAIQLLLTFLGTYGICCLGKHAGLPAASFSVMSIPLAVTVFLLLSRTRKRLEAVPEERARRRRVIFAAVLSFLFSVTMLAGYQLQVNGMTESGFLGKGLLLVRAACLSVAVFPFGSLFFGGIEKAGEWKPQAEEKRWKYGKVFGISALVIFVCLLPVWLAYYPIVMSYDFHRQINEAVKGFAWFWPYQPLAHTWVIWVFLQLGYLLGDIQTGMACMALFQMLVYSLAMAYGVVFLYRVTAKKWTAAAGVVYFGVFPLNSVMAVCTTKDVLFSILFLLFVLLLAERFFFADCRKPLWLDLCLVLEGSLMMQFRNNCFYAVVVFGVFWILFSAKKERLRVALLCVLLLAGGKGMEAGIRAALGTTLGTAKVEMFSVPIQQFARVGFYHGGEMDPETRKLLNTYVLEEDWNGYNPAIADSTKTSVGVSTFSEAWDGHYLQLFQDWLKIGMRYPNEYIDAFLELTRGYWFLDDRSYAECLGYGMEGRMGTIYTYNSAAIDNGPEIAHESKFPWLEERLERIVSANAYYNWPVISVIFKCAFYFWGLFLVLTAFLFLKKRKQALFTLFPVIYMATMLLGPVVQMRYIFPVMVTLPILVSLLFLGREIPAAVSGQASEG